MSDPISKDVEYIYKSDGAPFTDMRGAAGQKAHYEKSQGILTEVVELEQGGYALKVLSRRRPGRTPLGQRNVLTFKNQDPKYTLRVVNDKDGRIEMFQEAGWEIVHDKEKLGDEAAGNTRIPGTAVTKPVGGGVTGVLMRKRRDWFEEDEQVKQDQISEAEAGLIRQAQVDNLHTVAGNRPGIQIAHSRKHPGV